MANFFILLISAVALLVFFLVIWIIIIFDYPLENAKQATHGWNFKLKISQKNYDNLQELSNK